MSKNTNSADTFTKHLTLVLFLNSSLQSKN